MNYKQLIENLEAKFSEELFNGLTVSVKSNTRKIKDGLCSITIDISTEDNEKNLNGTIIIVSRPKVTTTIFINNYNKDIVFSNTGVDSLTKAEKYIYQYIERSVKRMLGIDDEAFNTNKKDEK